MNTRGLVALLLCLLILLSGCSKESSLEGAKAFYVEYAEMVITDTETALKEYRYYEDLDELQRGLRSLGVKTLSYKILEIQELSDNLWVFYVNLTQNHPPYEMNIYQFVAFMDGEYKVIVGEHNIPSALKEGIDLSPYENDLGFIDPEDIIQ